MVADCSIDVRFYRLSAALQPYFTALYSFDINCTDGRLFEDYLHPEWATMRFSRGTPPSAAIGSDPLAPQWPFVVSGPTSRSIHFKLRTARIWGLGLLPAGWGRFIPAPAHGFADRTLDGAGHPAFACFAPLLDLARAEGQGRDATAAAINAYLGTLAPPPNPHEGAIIACHEASRDPDVGSVTQLAERTGISPRSLERLCKRYFGFPPKMVLRRQRFLRSLAHFMGEGGRSWSESLDRQYCDQAHFVRDFRAFMGMTPSEYAEMPHPVIDPIMSQRMVDQGAAPPTDLPTVLRYSGQAPGAGQAGRRISVGGAGGGAGHGAIAAPDGEARD